MHIGRAHQLPPDIQPALQQRQQQAVLASAPLAVVERSAPTGQLRSQPPTFHPVTDLIARQTQIAVALTSNPPPPQKEASAYGGATPPPPVMDARA